jgi:hypothetical protein
MSSAIIEAAFHLMPSDSQAATELVPSTREAAELVPPTSEAPPSSKVPAVKGMTAADWRYRASGMLTTKADRSMTTKTANVTAKAADVATEAAEVATEAPSAVSCCHSRWSERQTQSDRPR